MRRQMSLRASRVGVGIEPLGGHARLLQRRHLVGHQRDQRRDDEAEAGPDQGGDLVAQALAAAGRQHGQRAAPGQHLADHAGLQAAEVGVTEGAAQDVARSLQVRGIARACTGMEGIVGHEHLMQRARGPGNQRATIPNRVAQLGQRAAEDYPRLLSVPCCQGLRARWRVRPGRQIKMRDTASSARAKAIASLA